VDGRVGGWLAGGLDAAATLSRSARARSQIDALNLMRCKAKRSLNPTPV